MELSMTRFKCLAIVALVAALPAACADARGDGGGGVPEGTPITAAAIEAHMRFLASDLLEGREAGTRGYDLAASYVAAQFQLLGLRPAGNGGSYLQAVPLLAHWVVRDDARLVVRPTGGRAVHLRLGEDYLISSSAIRARSAVTAPAVFAGYGVDAPAFSHRDYDGLDVSGKVVVVLAGYPARLPSEEGAHHGSSREKARAAAAHGAVGILTVYTERYETVLPWERASVALDSMSMAWIGPDGTPFSSSPEIQVSALLSPRAGAALFAGAERSYDEVRGEAIEGAPRGFPLAVSVDLAQGSRHERRTSANVAAALPGSDPALRHEYVVMLGHLDHEGVGPAVDGDSIYNGALDNAAGIASLLEAARALAGRPAPRRSILFLAVTAEEKGLLGSEYFARNPTVAPGDIVAAVNLDMPVLLYDFTDVIAFGANHSSLKAVVAAAVSQLGLTLTQDPMPQQALFTRSDHYRFVQQGVPSIFLATGWNTARGAGEGGKAFTTFLATKYHRPSDDLMQAIDYEAGARFARVNYLILAGIANADDRPRWNDGDFFGTLFARPAAPSR